MEVVGVGVELNAELLDQSFDPYEADEAPRSDVVGDDAEAQRRGGGGLSRLNAGVALHIGVAVEAYGPGFHG